MWSNVTATKRTWVLTVVRTLQKFGKWMLYVHTLQAKSAYIHVCLFATVFVTVLPKQFVFHGEVTWRSWERQNLKTGPSQQAPHPQKATLTSELKKKYPMADHESWVHQVKPATCLLCRTCFVHAKQCEGPNLSLNQTQSRPFGCISHSSWMANTASLVLFDSNNYYPILVSWMPSQNGHREPSRTWKVKENLFSSGWWNKMGVAPTTYSLPLLGILFIGMYSWNAPSLVLILCWKCHEKCPIATAWVYKINIASRASNTTFAMISSTENSMELTLKSAIQIGFT